MRFGRVRMQGGCHPLPPFTTSFALPPHSRVHALMIACAFYSSPHVLQLADAHMADDGPNDNPSSPAAAAGEDSTTPLLRSDGPPPLPGSGAGTGAAATPAPPSKRVRRQVRKGSPSLPPSPDAPSVAGFAAAGSGDRAGASSVKPTKSAAPKRAVPPSVHLPALTAVAPHSSGRSATAAATTAGGGGGGGGGRSSSGGAAVGVFVDDDDEGEDEEVDQELLEEYEALQGKSGTPGGKRGSGSKDVDTTSGGRWTVGEDAALRAGVNEVGVGQSCSLSFPCTNERVPLPL